MLESVIIYDLLFFFFLVETPTDEQNVELLIGPLFTGSFVLKHPHFLALIFWKLEDLDNVPGSGAHCRVL